MNTQTLQSLLVQLKLGTAASELENVLAKHHKAIHLDWVADLLEREIDARHEKALRRRIQDARFPEITTLEGFDFNFNSELDEGSIRDLASLRFVEQRQIALFLGPPGVGKTHIALAIGLLAVQAKRRVFCTSAKRLGQEILLCKRRGNLDNLFKRILSSHLWIIDDWGVVSMTREVAEEVFDLMDRRKSSTAMILTSNRAVSEWAEVFPDPIIANATIDRIFDRATTVIFNGKSYRLKGRISGVELVEITKKSFDRNGG
jgi:DNA replication protein DnaC